MIVCLHKYRHNPDNLIYRVLWKRLDVLGMSCKKLQTYNQGVAKYDRGIYSDFVRLYKLVYQNNFQDEDALVNDDTLREEYAGKYPADTLCVYNESEDETTPKPGYCNFGKSKNIQNPQSIEYQLEMFDELDDEGGNPNDFDPESDNSDHWNSGLLTLVQAQELVEQAKQTQKRTPTGSEAEEVVGQPEGVRPEFAEFNPIRADLYLGYTEEIDGYEGKKNELNDKIADEANKLNEARTNNVIDEITNECPDTEEVCRELQSINTDITNIQKEIENDFPTIDTLSNLQPKTDFTGFNLEEDFFFTVKGRITDPEQKIDEDQPQPQWLYIHLPTREILSILEKIAGKTRPEEQKQCEISRQDLVEEEKKCRAIDRENNNTACIDGLDLKQKCVYGIVEAGLKKNYDLYVPTVCPGLSEGDKCPEITQGLNQLKEMREFRRMRNELDLQMRRIRSIFANRDSYIQIHTCDSLKAHYRKLEKLRAIEIDDDGDKKIKQVFDDNVCQTNHLSAGLHNGFVVKEEGEDDEDLKTKPLLEYSQELNYLVCCPSAERQQTFLEDFTGIDLPGESIEGTGSAKDTGRTKNIIEQSCGGADIVWCSLPATSLSTQQ